MLRESREELQVNDVGICKSKMIRGDCWDLLWALKAVNNEYRVSNPNELEAEMGVFLALE